MTDDGTDSEQFVAAHDIPPLDWTRDLSAALFRNWDDRAWFFKGNQSAAFNSRFRAGRCRWRRCCCAVRRAELLYRGRWARNAAGCPT